MAPALCFRQFRLQRIQCLQRLARRHFVGMQRFDGFEQLLCFARRRGLGRGTATFDGLSIAWAAIEHLHESNRCRALFATHYHELTALSAKLPRMFNATVRVKEWQGDVVFLHEVLPGSADRSYGIQVAKLAGLPPAVIARAKSVLAKLEAQDRGQTAKALADDLPLFAVPSRAAAEPAPPSEAEQLLDAVKALHPDEMSPREALEALYALKAKLPKT